MPQEIKVELGSNKETTARLYESTSKKSLRSTLILGHGAGAGQLSDFMVSFSKALAERGLDVVTFNFLYTEEKRSAPDKGDKLEACYLSVIEAVSALKTLKGNSLFIGGKSMGGRIASQTVAKHETNVDGLIFLGYPLHPPGRLDQLRSAHLPDVKRPMLFIQGTRDGFGTPDELRPILKPIKDAEIFTVEGGDHSFKVLKSLGPQAVVYSKIQDKIVDWIVSRR